MHFVGEPHWLTDKLIDFNSNYSPEHKLLCIRRMLWSWKSLTCSSCSCLWVCYFFLRWVPILLLRNKVPGTFTAGTIYQSVLKVHLDLPNTMWPWHPQMHMVYSLGHTVQWGAGWGQGHWQPQEYCCGPLTERGRSSTSQCERLVIPHACFAAKFVVEQRPRAAQGEQAKQSKKVCFDKTKFLQAYIWCIGHQEEYKSEFIIWILT